MKRMEMMVIIECMKCRILKLFGRVMSMRELGYVKRISKDTNGVGLCEKNL